MSCLVKKCIQVCICETLDTSIGPNPDTSLKWEGWNESSQALLSVKLEVAYGPNKDIEQTNSVSEN